MTVRKPEFITFTGADDHTSRDEMLKLAVKYRIEWGLLFSLTRQGREPRYPSTATVTSFLKYSAAPGGPGLRFSAHLCGEHSRRVMDGHQPFIEHDYNLFRRFQVNTTKPEAAPIARFQKRVQKPCIAQARGEAFPDVASIFWLFDASGGRGIAPSAWPKHPGGDRLVGYAGGIGPDNVLHVIEAINSDGPYWIDMESGVRNEDRFDIDLCRRVCEAVYP